jgi:2-oxoglutarate ferredoxin oxidoreductase subunit alpha
MSRIRGGNNFFQLRASHQPVSCPRRLSRLIITLDKASPRIHAASLEPGGVIIADCKKFLLDANQPGIFDVPLYTIAAGFGDEMYINSAAAGIAAYICALGLPALGAVFNKIFSAKGGEITAKNCQAAEAGYKYAAANFKGQRFDCAPSAAGKYLLNGNDAIALAAIRAGCKFYTAYPMSPSTGIMTTIAEYASRCGILVEQAEDEIAAVNMAIGASFAGARAMAATSGGGFMLMMEGVSLAGMTETPLVVADIQRPAPATGFPTRTEQADLDFLLSAGHGEFARLIFTPGTPQEAFALTLKAFDLAEKYQIPAFILSDQYLADSYCDAAELDFQSPVEKRRIISFEESATVNNYKRYCLTDSGISPQAVPGWIKEAIYADSDEHTPEGHITEDAAIRVQMVEKRLYKKMAGLTREIVAPTAFSLDGADIVLVGFGSTYGLLRELSLASGKRKIGAVHLSQAWPFPSEIMAGLLKGHKRIFTLENNAGAQLAKLLRRETGITAEGSILKFDGRPFSMEDAQEKIPE